jgi:hypothetical protein
VRWLADLAPILGVIWAIYAYFRVRSDDRKDQRKLKLQVLYSDFIAKAEPAGKAARIGTTQDIFELHEVMELWALEKQISLMAEDPTTEAAANVMGEIGLMHQGKSRRDFHIVLAELAKQMREELKK